MRLQGLRGRVATVSIVRVVRVLLLNDALDALAEHREWVFLVGLVVF
jgi:hypothetical protein